MYWYWYWLNLLFSDGRRASCPLGDTRLVKWWVAKEGFGVVYGGSLREEQLLASLRECQVNPIQCLASTDIARVVPS